MVLIYLKKGLNNLSNFICQNTINTVHCFDNMNGDDTTIGEMKGVLHIIIMKIKMRKMRNYWFN